MSSMICVKDLVKRYAGGFQALNGVDLEIHSGEIFALLGPNGAGKTTLISMICGLNTITSGEITVGGHSIESDFRAARSLIGLVPQELTTDMFEPVWDTVSFSRGLFGLAPDPDYIERLLKQLSLWDKKDQMLMTLSGGMKRRVMIAKALSHEPKVLFLDEPTAGVDVALRKDMWDQISELRKSGVTIILTTHYIEEAEEMADRIGVINGGSIVVVDQKECLIKKLGKKQLRLTLRELLSSLPASLDAFHLSLEGDVIVYDYNAKLEETSVSQLFQALVKEGIVYHDIETRQTSLEDIFVELVSD